MGEFVENATVLKSTSKETSNGGHVYNIQVETDENGKEWFGCGFDDPKLNEGDIIEFEIVQVGEYTNVDLDTLEIIEKAPQRQRSSRGSSRGGSRSSGGRSSRGQSPRGSGSRSSGRGSSSRNSGASKSRGSSGSKKAEVDWDRKDKLIRLQSSQNTAIALVGMLLTHDALKLPAKKADKYDAAVAAVEKEAARLFAKYDDIVDGCYEPDGDAGGEFDDEDDVPQ